MIPHRRRARMRVFAVEDTRVQLTWRSLPPGTRALRVGPVEVTTDDLPADAPDRPGAVWVEGLRPATDHAVTIVTDAGPVAAGSVRTAPALGGAPTARVATVSDLHMGQRGCGLLPHLRDPDDAEAHPTRCLRAALAEIRAWGPDLVVVKGDITNDSRAEEYDAAALELKAVDVPMLVVPGNHDGASHRSADPVEALGRHGIAVTTDVAFHDLPGLRVVVANTNHPGGRHWGHLPRRRIDAIAEAAADAPDACLVAVHHAFQLTFVPTYWPVGLWGTVPHRLLRALHEANPRVFVTAGHSHRNRSHRRAPVPVTDVGSTKDHPGVWAAYTAHPDGIRQTVRRIAEPDVVAWTERTADVLFGQWGRWSPGRLEDRSITHRWPDAPAAPTAPTEPGPAARPD